MSKHESKADELARALEQADIDVDDLVGAVEQYNDGRDVSRRDLLGAGAGLLGLGGLASSATGNARAGAGSQSVGGVGTASNPVDIVAEDIFPPGGSGSGNSTFIEKIETATIVDDDTGTAYDVGDDLAGGAQTHAHGYLSSAESISSGANEVVNFDSQLFDPNDVFDGATGEVQVDVDGVYAINAQVRLEKVDPDTRTVINLVKNSNTIGLGDSYTSTFRATPTPSIHQLVDLTTSDTVTVEIFQDQR